MDLTIRHTQVFLLSVALSVVQVGCEDKGGTKAGSSASGTAAVAGSGTSGPTSTAGAKAEADGPTPSDGKVPALKCGDKWPNTMAKDKKTILGCVILEDTTVRGMDCTKMGRVELYEGGAFKSCKLKKARTFAGVPCRTERDTSFFKSGKLKACAFAKPFKTNEGMVCKYRATFHENGKVRRCQTSEDKKFGDTTAPALSWVALTKEAKLKRVEFPKGKPLKFKDHTCKEAYFHDNGGISVCVINEKMKLKGETTPLSIRLCFDDKGAPTKDLKGGWACYDPEKIKLLEKVIDEAKK
jgi:hypothetical protein